MEHSRRQKVFRYIFLPALLLSILLASSSSLFFVAQNTLLMEKLDFSQIPALNILKIFPQIVFVLTLLLVSRVKPFEKVFRGTLIALVGITALLTGLFFFQDHLLLKGITEILRKVLPSNTVQMYAPLIENWPLSLLYIVKNLLNFNLFSLLIWGFVNRLAPSSQGIKYFIPLAAVFGFISSVFRLAASVGLGLKGFSNESFLSMVIPALVLMIFALMIFNWGWKRLPDYLLHPNESLVESKLRFPFLAGAYFLAMGVMIEMFLKVLLKKPFSDPKAYVAFLGNYSLSVGQSGLYISILWAVLGTLLILYRGWRAAALWGSISTVIGGFIFLSFSVTTSVSWLGQGIFVGFLKATTSMLFFPLIQILYLYLPYQARFRTKVITEMIALPLMTAIPSIIMQGLIVILGSISAMSIYLKILIPILLILFVFASRRVSSRYATLSALSEH